MKPESPKHAPVNDNLSNQVKLTFKSVLKKRDHSYTFVRADFPH